MRGYRKSVLLLVVLLLAVVGVLAFRGLTAPGSPPMGEEKALVQWQASGESVRECGQTENPDMKSGGKQKGEFQIRGDEKKDNLSEKETSKSTATGKASYDRTRTNGKTNARANGKTNHDGTRTNGKTSRDRTQTNGKTSHDRTRTNGKTNHDRIGIKEKKNPSGNTQKSSGKKTSKKRSPSPAETPTPGWTEAPAESESVEAQEVFIRIECTEVFDHRDLWKSGLEDVIPGNGIFFEGTYRWQEGLTVYDVLSSVCEREGIPLDSQFTPMFHTYYVRGIGNLYEFDCGGESGWKYMVNGVTPGVGSSAYRLKAGEKITFFYTCQI